MGPTWGPPGSYRSQMGPVLAPWTLLSGLLTHIYVMQPPWFNTLRPRQNRRHFADDIFKCIFLNEIVWIPIKISLKFVPKFPINNIPALVQIMAWRRPGDKPLFEAMMIKLMTCMCVTRPQWVKDISWNGSGGLFCQELYPHLHCKHTAFINTFWVTTINTTHNMLVKMLRINNTNR